MKIGVFPADLYGCGYYRLIWPAMQLQLDGHDVDVIHPADRANMFSAEVDEMTGNLTGEHVNFPRQYDVIVLQRVTHKHLAQAIPYMRAAGTAIVIDIDDDLEHIPQSNPMYTMLHPRKTTTSRMPDHAWTWARHAIESATMVVVTTQQLADHYGRKTPWRVLPNYVPAQALTVPHEDSAIFGWGGGTHSHAEDIPVLGNAVSRLVAEGHHFRIIGPDIGVRQAFRLEKREDFDATGPIELKFWISALSMLGVGIAPLATSTFNRSKSWLKPMEYAAAGVPCVVSPSPAYRELTTRYGIGDIAEKPKDWYRLVRRLVTDEAYRLERSAAGRAAAEELTIEKHAWRWMEAWSDALAIQCQ
jgi:glycosyltransferase involved in cell wall biosynthesis